MLKNIIVLLLLALGTSSFALSFNEENIDYNEFPRDYIYNVKEIVYNADYVKQIKTKKFKDIVKEHKFDKNHIENALAAEANKSPYKGNNLKALFSNHFDIMYMYTLQKATNQRIIYIYTVSGKLKLVEFLYEEYPAYPYYARVFTTSGKIVNTIFYPDEDTKIFFNKDCTKARIVFKGETVKKIDNI